MYLDDSGLEAFPIASEGIEMANERMQRTKAKKRKSCALENENCQKDLLHLERDITRLKITHPRRARLGKHERKKLGTCQCPRFFFLSE